AALTTVFALADRISIPVVPVPVPAAAAQVRPASARPIGDASTGKALFASKGCIACHVAQGVSGAVGVIGPTMNGLGDTSKRGTLADGEPNTPANVSS